MTGWAVEVRFQYMDGGWTPAQIWYVSSSVKEDAEKAVRETANVGESVRVEAKARSRRDLCWNWMARLRAA